MKSEQGGGGGRENGYPRTPEPEISKPLAGLPKPLAFGPPAMPGLSFPPNLGGLGKIVPKISMIFIGFSQADSPVLVPLDSVFYLQGPTRECQVCFSLQFSLYSDSDEYFVGPIRRRITDKAPMSLPSGKRGDLSQKSEEGSLKLSSMLSPYGLNIPGNGK